MTKAERYPCPGCGADLVFDPEHNSLLCLYCGHKEALPTTAAKVEERSFEQHLQQPELGRLAEDALEVTCTGCGATVSFKPPEVAGECPFCGRAIVAQPRSADPIVAPEAVLPFHITKSQANAAIKTWLSSRWFAPNALKRLAYQESISGLYLPFWTFDANTESNYSGKRGDYYYETESYTERDAQGNLVTKNRQVRRVQWHAAAGMVARSFDDVLVAGTKSISRPRLTSLEPWDLDLLEAYNPAYLSGFKAQRYELALGDSFEEAKTIMAHTIEDDVRRDIGGDEQVIDQVSTSYSNITFKHILLPVYLGAYRFNQKSYQVMINARTGEVQGDRPYSAVKIAFFILFLLIVFAAIAYFKGE